MRVTNAILLLAILLRSELAIAACEGQTHDAAQYLGTLASLTTFTYTAVKLSCDAIDPYTSFIINGDCRVFAFSAGSIVAMSVTWYQEQLFPLSDRKIDTKGEP